MPSTPRRAAPSRRRALGPVVVLGAVAAVIAGLGYVAARETSLFALRTIDVRGASPEVAAAVRRALAGFEGESLVALDADEVRRAARRVPFVRGATVDRSFPSSVVVQVVEERPVAVVRHREDAWLVGASGRVLGRVARGEREQLPRIWLPDDTPPLAAGRGLTEAQGAAAARTVAQVPEEFPVRIVAARGTADAMTLVLPGKVDLRLGDTANLERKLAAATAVLTSLDEERASLAYLDVTLPTRPVGGSNSQVEGSA